MSAIHIFKAGTHTDMHGKKLPFTPDDLAACVKAYDPSVHEAPLVIGHPRTEDPAWGWVKALSLSGVDLMAEPAQLDPQFAEMVTDGRFKSVRLFLPPGFTVQSEARRALPSPCGLSRGTTTFRQGAETGVLQ